MKVELFGNVVPNTVANFKSLCLNADTVFTLQNPSKARNYNNAEFYKIVKGFFAIGGDIGKLQVIYNYLSLHYMLIVNNDGTSGEAEAGMVMADENFVLKVTHLLIFNTGLQHEAKYLLSMVRDGEHRMNSKFIITYGVLPFLDEQYTVFGKVKSDSILIADQIEQLAGEDFKGQPVATALIKSCVTA